MKGLNKKTRLLSFLCLLLCISLLVCACTGSGNETVTEPPSEAPTETEENTTPQTPPVKNETKSYTIKVQTSEGGIEGVQLQLCKGDVVHKQTTNASGIAVFKLDKTEDINDWRIKLVKFPTGYAGDMQKEYAFAAGTSALAVTLTEYRVDLSDMLTGVANVGVSIKQGETEIAKGKSDDQGTIAFLLAADTYTVTLEIPQNYRLIGDELEWELNTEQKNRTIYLLNQNNKLEKTVTVKDHEGNLVAGATVMLWTPDSVEAVGSKVTDAEGKVTFGDLNATTNYGVTVSVDGFTTQRQNFATFATTSMVIALPQILPPSEVTYKANVVLGDGSAYTATAVTMTLVCQQTVGNGYTYTTVKTAQTQDGVATFTIVPVMYATYFVSIASADLPEGYVLIDLAQNHNLFGFVENSTETAIAIEPTPAYGTVETPDVWYNYSNVEYPFYETDNEMAVTLEAGQTYYIQLVWSSGMQLTFTGDATVTYGDATYAAGDTIVFTEESPMQGNAQAVISVTSANGATVTLTTSEVPVEEE
ncbi:MAG: carboxypeptidase regulatory-like domain-containing protein [Clostridia bacterium]|nr:carboxypeptidase regulatory-like domain-containing protein [Clostridia bacterium]